MRPTDNIEVTVERATGRRRGKWERLFGGFLDLPWSLRVNRLTHQVTVQAFAFSKILERASADTIRRSLDGLTGSVTAASKVVTISDTTNLRADDRIRLRDNTNDETQTIAKVLTGTTVQTIGAWTNTFAAGTPLTCETPFHRDSSIQSLADLVFAAAGITSRTIEILNRLAAYPIATPANTTTYPRDATMGLIVDPKSLMPRGVVLEARLTDGAINTRGEAPDPADPWAMFTTGSVRPLNDWTPYQDTEPATFPNGDGSGNNPFIDFDDGKVHASDHDANFHYNFAPGGGIIDLHKDGTNLGTAFTVTNAGSAHTFLDVDPVSGDVWVSCTGATGATGDKDNVKVWNGAAFVSIETAFSGMVRYLRRLKLIAIHEVDQLTALDPTTTMRLYDPATRALVRTVTVPENLWAWTLRVWQDEAGLRIAGLYTQLGTTRLRIWDDSWNQIADYLVAGAASGIAGTRALLTIYTDSEGVELPVGSAGNVLFVVAKGYRGVVPYADFSDLSCAAALRELALVSMSYVDVDAFKIGTLRGRGIRDAEALRQAYEIDTPLEMEVWPLTEFYRASAKISGTDPAGQSIEAVTGDVGDSARRIELDGQLVTTGGLAEAVGNEYVSFLSVERRQAEVTVKETGRVLRPTDYVVLDAATWRVLQADLQTIERKQNLRLLEAA